MPTPFPRPATIAGRNYWRRGAIRRWLADAAREPEPAPRADDESMMTARAVRDMCGGVSDMWIWRRRREARATDAAASGGADGAARSAGEAA